MKIIALDLGSNMALAHNGMDVPIVDSKEFKGPRSYRAGQILGWLDVRFIQIRAVCPIGLVVYERPFARGMDATRCGWGIAGIIEALAWKQGWAVTDTDPQTIKKFATGHARAEKEQMIEAARRMGYTGHNEHEADCFCLLKYAEANATILPAKGSK
jgi:hypothetical protein